MTISRIRIPEALAASHRAAWIAGLPALAADCSDRWELRLDGAPSHGTVALVLPVVRADGTLAVLKLQPVDDETRGEPLALTAWAGRGAVSLLETDPGTGAMLLERLDAGRSLAAVDDDMTALQVLSEVLSRLVALPAPDGVRRLADIAAAMLRSAPVALARLADPADRRLAQTCAAAMRELCDEPGDRLLHWDLHYDNVLAPLRVATEREPWLAIDPKPLIGDPGFDLLPALRNRWDEVAASGDAARAVRRRFDLMTEVLGLDRQRAAGWTLGRVLQNTLWDLEDGETSMDPAQAVIARALLTDR
ncbi:aminoglycoside phosphotransferase family protein [Streptomyces sp. NBC_01006]|uniref:aminoglycoside phosphotransferase family protein n=1 Tax=Streptomyces sp. NBC_01006 TaxID=2903716 RepID=UPI00386F2457|nr:aminoglycoside phosphotransferase family protein [Streptomyces sp. NBC_01006]